MGVLHRRAAALPRPPNPLVCGLAGCLKESGTVYVLGMLSADREGLQGRHESRRELVVVGTQPRLFVGPWKPGVLTSAYVADSMPPEVLPSLPQTDPISPAFVCVVLELEVVVFPATYGAGLEGSRGVTRGASGSRSRHRCLIGLAGTGLQ
jgi:hypothetical protein